MESLQKQADSSLIRGSDSVGLFEALELILFIELLALGFCQPPSPKISELNSRNRINVIENNIIKRM